MINIKDNKNLVKDESNNLIINRDNNKLEAYKLQRKILETQNAKINTIEQELIEIKKLLIRILNKE